ncbi:MAG: zinc ribbon domain-containing protein [Acidobacteriota bacterium]
MKKCPFCAEEIQGDAIKCKHCGEWLTEQTGRTGSSTWSVIPIQTEIIKVAPPSEESIPRQYQEKPPPNSAAQHASEVIATEVIEDDEEPYAWYDSIYNKLFFISGAIGLFLGVFVAKDSNDGFGFLLNFLLTALSTVAVPALFAAIASLPIAMIATLATKGKFKRLFKATFTVTYIGFLVYIIVIRILTSAGYLQK